MLRAIAAEDTPAPVAALRAVLDLHESHECLPPPAHWAAEGCWIMLGGECGRVGVCQQCSREYPCPTVRAITKALA